MLKGRSRLDNSSEHIGNPDLVLPMKSNLGSLEKADFRAGGWDREITRRTYLVFESQEVLNKTRRENYIAVYDTESSNPVLCSNRGVGGEVHEVSANSLLNAII